MSDVIAQEVDARGLNCPLPILRIKKAMGTAEAGDQIRLLATDPGAMKDVEAFCKQTGNELVTSEQSNDEFVFVIQKH